MEQVGYEWNDGIEEDKLVVMNGGRFETSIIGDIYLEFTLVLKYPNRVRVAITKNAN